MPLPPTSRARLFLCCAALLISALPRDASAAVQWRRVGTVQAGTLTANQFCYTDANDIICDTNAPTLSGGNVGIGSTSPVASLDMSQKTDALALPSGSAAQRPTAVNGMIRYNTGGVGSIEAYLNGAWTILLNGAGGGSAAGSNWQVQYNNAGALAGGTNFVWDNANGRLGIGTTSPSVVLDVQGSGTPLSRVSSAGGAGHWASTELVSGEGYIFRTYKESTGRTQFLNPSTTGTDDFVFKIGGTEVVNIKEGGNVGIGSTSPVASLDLSQKTDALALPSGSSAQRPTAVNGMIRYNTGGVGSLEAYLNGAWTTLLNGAGGGSAAGSNWQVQYNNAGALAGGTNFVWDDTNGRLGIGTTSPSYKLDVQDSFAQVLSITNTTNITGINSGLIFRTGYGGLTNNYGAVYGRDEASTASGTLSLWTRTSGSLTEKVTVMSTGNVGIGTTSPAQALHIYGGSGSYPAIELSANASGTNSLLMTYNNGTDYGLQISGQSTSPYVLFSNYTKGVSIGTSYSTSSAPSNGLIVQGNVGIGTKSPSATLDIEPGSASGNPNTAAGMGLRVGTLTYTDTATAASGTATAFSAQSIANPTLIASNSSVTTTNASTLYINGAPTGGANETITNSRALTINGAALTNVTNGYGLYVNAPTGATNNYGAVFASGNVGIGTASPAAQLDVVSSGSTLLRVKDSSTGNVTSIWPNWFTVAAGTSNTYTGFSIQDAGQQWNFEKQASGYLDIRDVTNSKTTFTILPSSGNVGIGTTSPQSLLQVYNGEVQTGSSGAGCSALNAGALRYSGGTFTVCNGSTWSAPSAAAGGSNWQVQYNNAGALAGGTNFVWDDTNGRLGIGTVSPVQALDVRGSAQIGARTGDASIELGSGATTNRFAYIDLTGDTTYTDFGLRLMRGSTGANTGNYLQARGTGGLYLTTVEAAPIIFQATNTEAMRINSNGNVGIGTTSPGSKLQVNGGAAVGYSTSTAAPANGLAVSGQVGIGTASPAASVAADINGPVKVAGTGSEPCTAAQVGSIRYNPSGNYFELCSYP